MIIRRELLKRSTLLAAFATSGPIHELFAKAKNKIKIGACDWSVGRSPLSHREGHHYIQHK